MRILFCTRIASINKAPVILRDFTTVRFDKSASLRCHRSHLGAFYQSMQFDEKNDSTRRAAKYTSYRLRST